MQEGQPSKQLLSQEGERLGGAKAFLTCPHALGSSSPTSGLPSVFHLRLFSLKGAPVKTSYLNSDQTFT